MIPFKRKTKIIIELQSNIQYNGLSILSITYCVNFGITIEHAEEIIVINIIAKNQRQYIR